MAKYEVVELGAGRVDAKTGLPVVHGSTPVSDDGNDSEPFGELAQFYPIGFASLPAPKTSSGWAEGFVARDAAGMDAVMLGGRDSRAASIYGNMKSGDTAVFSTGANNASQLLLKESTKQACLITLDTANKHIVMVLDGEDDKVLISGFGQAIQLSRADGCVIGNENGQLIIDADGNCHIKCPQVLVGANASALTPVAYNAAGPTNLVSTSVFVST